MAAKADSDRAGPHLPADTLARASAGSYNGEPAHFWRTLDPALREAGLESSPEAVTPIGPAPLHEGFWFLCWREGDPYGPKTAVVVLRGTRTDEERQANWRTGRSHLPGRWGGRRPPWAHAGFDGMWRPVADEIRGGLLGCGAGLWVFTGLSRGGAMASIAAADAASGALADLVAEGGGEPPQVECVTFCAPRPGGPALAAAVSAACPRRCDRWVVGSDLVPCLPPAAMGFRHPGRCRYLRELKPGAEPAEAAAVSLAGGLAWLAVTSAAPSMGPGPVGDHNIDRLVEWFAAERAAGRVSWD